MFIQNVICRTVLSIYVIRNAFCRPNIFLPFFQPFHFCYIQVEGFKFNIHYCWTKVLDWVIFGTKSMWEWRMFLMMILKRWWEKITTIELCISINCNCGMFQLIPQPWNWEWEAYRKREGWVVWKGFQPFSHFELVFERLLSIQLESLAGESFNTQVINDSKVVCKKEGLEWQNVVSENLI